MTRVPACLLTLLVASCELPVIEEPPVDNEAPVARLVGPQLARVGEPASYDASFSDDADGTVATVSFVFSDGSGLVEGDTDGLFEHVFAAAGRFAVRAEVFDDQGAVTPTAIDTVVVEGEIEPCTCASPCLDAGVCTATGCVVVATSADETAPVPDDVVGCEG